MKQVENKLYFTATTGQERENIYFETEESNIAMGWTFFVIYEIFINIS